MLRANSEFDRLTRQRRSVRRQRARPAGGAARRIRAGRRRDSPEPPAWPCSRRVLVLLAARVAPARQAPTSGQVEKQPMNVHRHQRSSAAFVVADAGDHVLGRAPHQVRVGFLRRGWRHNRVPEWLGDRRATTCRPRPSSGIAALVYTPTGYDGLIYSIGFLVGWPVVMFLMAERLRNLGKFTFADVVSYRMSGDSHARPGGQRHARGRSVLPHRADGRRRTIDQAAVRSWNIGRPW